MSQSVDIDEYDSGSVRGNNNPAPRLSQNKPQLLEAMMRNIPKLKELNYSQWNNMMSNSIKKAKLWEYVDGSIEEPSEHDANKLAIYYDEAGAVRNAILGSLEPGARRYIEDTLDPKDAWLALEKKYLTAEAEADAEIIDTEQRLANLRLEEGGDVIEHIAEFCRMRCHLSGTRFSLDDQACIGMLYRSLSPSYRQSVLTSEGTEMKDFNALCGRLNYLSQNPEPEPATDSPPVEDHTNWGVPEDIKAFGLTGDRNPQLAERAALTCRDCLLKGHKPGSTECPQYEWRRELWGAEACNVGSDNSGNKTPEQPITVNTKRLSYEFSEPVKVLLEFDELGLKPELRQKPLAVQQCIIVPIVHGRNVLARAPPQSGKTTALVMSIIQMIDTTLRHPQVIVFTSTDKATTAFQETIRRLGYTIQCYAAQSSTSYGLSVTDTTSLTNINAHHLFVGTPNNLLGMIRRNIITMRKIRTVVLDDIDKIIEATMGDKILEVYRYIPPLVQVVASTTVLSSSVAKVAAKLQVDPLQILVDRDEGVSIGTHFYITVSAEQRASAMNTMFLALGQYGLIILCRDLAQREQMEHEERQSVVKSFESKINEINSRNSNRGYSYAAQPKKLDPVVYAGLVATDAGLSFITVDTDEINIIQDLERRYGVHVVSTVS
ncbi:DEAD domain-containing protein [Rhizoctonia solani AG-1 IA]|uniref:RNA helicase n=1 Tax=Thanatephorus cucumeris (strain AG1-IA) TaxID=983506 RepID=L8X544_THACA|nr:DEAD domain-containing protein [Rhizoctonia solani AG-1 IA]